MSVSSRLFSGLVVIPFSALTVVANTMMGGIKAKGQVAAGIGLAASGLLFCSGVVGVVGFPRGVAPALGVAALAAFCVGGVIGDNSFGCCVVGEW